MTNPFEDALHFLLHDRVAKGDGPSSAQAQKHIEAIAAAKDESGEASKLRADASVGKPGVALTPGSKPGDPALTK